MGKAPAVGVVAFCSQGKPGLITNDVPQEVTYQYCKPCYELHGAHPPAGGSHFVDCVCSRGMAFVGVHLSSGEINGREFKVGDPWSSRTPIVLGNMSEAVMLLGRAHQDNNQHLAG